MIVSNILGWAGFRSWKFWLAGAFAVLFGGLVLTNTLLKSELQSVEAQKEVAEQQLDQALDKNESLVTVINRLQVGAFVDESLVLSNQQEVDKLREETNERREEIARQPSGPAAPAIVCAITRVCD